MKKILLATTMTLLGTLATLSPASANTASWYGPKFHGKLTASGETFNQNALTAAHKKLKMGTKVRVTNVKNGSSVVVCINDRGPYHGNRVIDLSKAAAKKIGMLGKGTAKVKLKILHTPKTYRYGKPVCS